MNLAHVVSEEDENKTLCGVEIPLDANRDFFWHRVRICRVCLEAQGTKTYALGAMWRVSN